ncbi:type IV pilin [Salinirubrum litoreum]|uniref:Type IV pilin n=1 Tax=Salinirubrum litoreum TaxID=1126234 RepID=A0ABD5R6M5_9EURY|nr:type IV pilin [Salinirubrum litoreum]
MGVVQRFRALDRSVQVLLGVGLLGALSLVAVLVTVVLAAVIGSFVLGVGGPVQETAPQANIVASGVDTNDDGVVEQVTVRHEGGDHFTANAVVIAVRDEQSPWERYDSDVGDSVVVGDEAVIPGVESGDRIEVRHTETNSMLVSYTVP